jgi:putative transposase
MWVVDSVMLSGMVRDGVIDDELWSRIEPVLPCGQGRRGRPWNDHRRTLEGICWRFRAGTPWRDVPSEFGRWSSLWRRHRTWSHDGTYDKMFAAVGAGRPIVVDPAEALALLGVDSTIVRAHQHAAGAPKDGLGSPAAEATTETPVDEPEPGLKKG